MTSSRLKNRVQSTENREQRTNAVGADLVGALKVESVKMKVESLLRFFALLKMTASLYGLLRAITPLYPSACGTSPKTGEELASYIPNEMLSMPV